ncbi:MAG: DUF2341 domain-containing protein, partial [Bacteroidales bacterium]
MKSDFSDLRFTSDDGATLIPFWVESYVSSTSAVVWVNVPSIPASGTATVYMYYGNPSATSVANASSTFDLFDDFETSYSSNSSRWTQEAAMPYKTADASAAVYNGQLYVFGGYNNTASDILNSAYSYDPASNTWSQKADMPTARWGEIAVQYGGKIYVFGGRTSSVQTYQGNPLNIPDYGSGNVLHPDVVYFPSGKDGYKYWMMYTPYSSTVSKNETPCVVRSNDGITWTATGITNPSIPVGVAPGDEENPDPDFVYVSDYNKWFMVWDPGDVKTDSRQIALAWSSDGKTWIEYNGTTVNGNADPIVLAGNDTYGQAWERSGIYSKTCTPTLLYENGVFYLYYAEEASGTNHGKAGLATFTWNDATHSITAPTRNSGNPIINLPQDSTYENGIGHIDVAVSPTDNTYYMYGCRAALGTSVGFQVVLLTSSDKVSWTSKGTVLTAGSGMWDSDRVYRSCPTVDQTGKIVLFNNMIQLFYTGETGSGPTCKIGIAYTTPFGVKAMSNEIYDPTANNWAEGPSGPVLIGDQGLMGIAYGSVIHLFYHQYHYVYDPSAGTYTRKADVPTPRTWGTCAVVNGKIYLIGGYSYDTSGNPINPSSVNEVYDPASDTWSTQAPLPTSEYGVTRENPVIGGKIYVTHGVNSSSIFQTSVYIYDPSTNSWSQGPSASHARDGVACGVISNKLYVVGGRADWTGPYGLNYNEQYDPTPSQWALSDPTRVYIDASAAHTGGYGLLINDNLANSYEYAEHDATMSTMVVDVDWDITNALGTATTQPQGRILLVSPSSYGNGTLYYFNDAGTPEFEWYYNNAFTVLQSGSWNTWYHISIVWAGANSKVIINGVAHPVTANAVPSDRVRLDTSLPELTREYFDNVVVHKYAAVEPSFSIGDEKVPRYLTVTSVHGSPSPTAGVQSYADGATVTASVTSPVTEGSLIWTCTGWTGTGSVPASGSATTVTFTITQDSSITWNWVSYVLHVFGNTAVGGSVDAWASNDKGGCRFVLSENGVVTGISLYI